MKRNDRAGAGRHDSADRPIRLLVWYWGRRGGGPRFTLELVRAMSGRHDVELHLSLSKQCDLYDQFSSVEVAGRYDVDTYRSATEFALASCRLPLVRRRLGRYIREKGIDVVLCTMDHLWNAYLAPVVRDAGALYLLTVHDASRHPGEDQAWRELLLAREIAASDGTLVLTNSVGESLRTMRSYPAHRIFKAAHGHFGDYVRDVPRHLPADRPVRLLFFGRILPYKGLDLLLDALALLRSRHPDVELEIWGEGDLGSLRRRIEQTEGLRVENRWIDEAEIPGIFERTDLLMLPYREASQSGVVGIAQAYGMPSVATPIPGLCEQVHNEVDGVIATEVAARAFADAVTGVIAQPDRYSRLSSGCLRTAREELSWDRIGEAVLGAVRTLNREGRR